MTPATVPGVGLWTPRHPDVAAWRAGGADVPAPSPPASLLPPALRRRTGLLCRMVAEAVGQALATGGADPSTTPVVYASVYGETAAAVEMMASFATGEGLPSPITFHNSVHNAPAGYLSIATGCRAFSPSLAAGPETVAMALLEGALLLGERGGDVVVALADEPVPAPLGLPGAFAPGAVAFLLRAGGRSARWHLGGPRRGAGRLPEVPVELAAHPCVAAFRLASALLGDAPGPVSLGEGAPDDWVVDLEAGP